MTKAYKPNFIDLFAGAGGLSEGFIQAGFQPIAHVEMEDWACDTLETRAAYHYLVDSGNGLEKYRSYEKGIISRDEFFKDIPDEVKCSVIRKEMSDDTIKEVFDRIDKLLKQKHLRKVDLVIGGPPCQAYSYVGRAQSSHMDHAMSDDPRNELYKLYTQFLKKYQPKMFVFENVAGITTAQNGKAIQGLKEELESIGYVMEPRLQKAVDFGVMQNRKRMIIVGWKDNTKYKYPIFPKKDIKSYVHDLLDDLPSLERGTRKSEYLLPYSQINNYLKETGIRKPDDVLTAHVCRPNTKRDVEIYRKVIEAWNKDHSRLKYDTLPDRLKTHKNEKSFLDRFKVVEGDMHACHTVLAHLSKDGHYFIHPDISQCRSISVREAARLQTFPDDYYFEGSRTTQFIQIGNAVPPLMAKEIAKAIKKQLG